MKKLIRLLVLSIMLLIPINVFAAGSITVSPGSLSITPGGSKSFTIKANNAAGRVDISSSNTKVATVSISNSFLDNNSVTVTVKGVGEGSASINIRITDAATYDSEVLSGTKTVSVKVAPPVTTTQSVTDATLSKLSIEGYEIDFNKSTYEYSLEVGNEVSSINVSAITNTSNSKVKVIGADSLTVGENIVKIEVTAGDGKTNKTYTIKVVRKDDVPVANLETLESILANTTKDEVVLNVESGTVIPKDVFKKIKDSNKAVEVRVVDDNTFTYGFKFNSNSIDSLDDFDTTLNLDDNSKIDVITNYSKYLSIKYNYAGKLPVGTIVRVRVADKYEDNTELNVYKYVDNELVKVKDTVKVKDGYVDIVIDSLDELVLTRATVSKASKEASKLDIKTIIIIVESIIIVGLIIFIIVISKNKKKTKKLF